MILSYNDYNRYYMSMQASPSRPTPVPHMQSLTSVLAKAVQDGYTVDFKVTDKGLTDQADVEHNNAYQPEQVSVDNFYRFEGQSDPEDNSILYLLSTHDGIKGTLIDAYGAYADVNVSQFITAVQGIEKKTPHAHS